MVFVFKYCIMRLGVTSITSKGKDRRVNFFLKELEKLKSEHGDLKEVSSTNKSAGSLSQPAGANCISYGNSALQRNFAGI